MQLFLAVLVLFGMAFGMAALPLLRCPRFESKHSFGPLVPHPSQPGSMLTFAFLPSFLMLLSLARFGVFLWVSPLEDLVNGPDSTRRILGTPRGVDVDIVRAGPDGRLRFAYPPNTAELTIQAVRTAESTEEAERAKALRDVAWWMAVCPNYSRFVLPRLARALQDPDPAVRGAAVIGLGSTGGHGAPAIPDLLSARGTTVPHFDHLVTEAVLLIEQTPPWPAATECEDVPDEELERRAAEPTAAVPGP